MSLSLMMKSRLPFLAEVWQQIQTESFSMTSRSSRIRKHITPHSHLKPRSSGYGPTMPLVLRHKCVLQSFAHFRPSMFLFQERDLMSRHSPKVSLTAGT